MQRARVVMGLLAAAFLILSSAAHSILGWRAIGARLADAHVAADLQLSVKLGWQFGGVAMLAFGLLALNLFWRRFKGETLSGLQALIIALTYLGFGAWALRASGDPFFFVFIVPGLLLLVAAV